MTEHDLTRMVTLTHREQTAAQQRREVVHRVQCFVKRLKRRYPKVRYIAVLEWHPGGHGWHVHMVVDRFLRKDVLADLWGWGFVDVRLIRPKGEQASASSRRKAAQYVAKYIGKGEDEDHPTPPHERGDQRYLRSEGLEIIEIEAEGEAHALIVLAFGHLGRVGWLWWSGSSPEWRGPPVMVMRSE